MTLSVKDNVMLVDDLDILVDMVLDYGVKDTISGLIVALREAADEYSDMGLKETAIQAANMADTLEKQL